MINHTNTAIKFHIQYYMLFALDSCLSEYALQASECEFGCLTICTHAYTWTRHKHRHFSIQPSSKSIIIFFSKRPTSFCCFYFILVLLLWINFIPSLLCARTVLIFSVGAINQPNSEFWALETREKFKTGIQSKGVFVYWSIEIQKHIKAYSRNPFLMCVCFVYFFFNFKHCKSVFFPFHIVH